MLLSVWPEWKIESELGRGSYGAVFKAVREDDGFKSYSAIKVVTIPQSKSEISSLLAEGMTEEQSRTYLSGIVKSFVNEIKIMVSPSLLMRSICL